MRSRYPGASPQEIAEWTGVSMYTAERWKTGYRKPGPVATRLIDLHMSGRVRPNTHAWQQCFFQEEILATREGHTFHPNELLQYAFLRHLLYNAQRDIEAEKTKRQQAEDYIQYLESQTPRAPVIELPREQTRPTLTANMDDNPYFQKTKSA